ncbi:hypothetical protein NHG23_04220, partial [Aerococcaceae bacterium NML190073]|nr:hypothetical protein [Aerococcaceae bacterium NML190073]
IGDVGILYEKDINSLLTRELTVLRVLNENNKYNLTPFNLLFLLNSNEVSKQLASKIMMDTTLPNISERWKELQIPIYEKEVMDNLSDGMKKLYDSREKFWKEFKNISLKNNLI